MVRLRLSRTGAKKKPFYHVIATDQRSRRDGRFIERLGYFNPVARGKETPLLLDLERIEYWQGQGAQASERVVSLIKTFKSSGAAEKIAADAQAAEDEAKPKTEAAPAAKKDAAKADDKPAEKADAKAEPKKADAKKADADKAEPKKADAKKADEDKADEKKADADAKEDPKADAKADDADAEAKKA